MAPLFDAYDVYHSGSIDGAEVYEGKVDPKWSIGRLFSSMPTIPMFALHSSIPLEVRNFRANKIGGMLSILAICSDSPGYAFGLITEAYTRHQEKHKPAQVSRGRFFATPPPASYDCLQDWSSIIQGRLRVTALALLLTVTPERSHGYHIGAFVSLVTTLLGPKDEPAHRIYRR